MGVDDPKQGGEELHHEPEKVVGPLAMREEEILKFWQEQGIFEKSLAKPSPKGEYVFYDGPPFATGLPHYGHLLQSALKDAVPRYRTMQGYRVARRWGWDCHGLPLENQIEQELKFKTKRDIETYGIEKFNAAARNAVLRYAEDWKTIIPRFGRWIDMDQDYRTMDAPYTESVWWAFKNLFDRKLIYEGYKSMHLCPRCGTTLSNFEVAQGYKDIEDIAVTVKLPLIDEPSTSLLIWTTTAWSLPGNAAAAVKADAKYVKVKVGNEYVIAAKELAPEGEIVGEIEGKKLVGKKYEPPFDYFRDEIHKHKTHVWKVYAADFVTLSEGTGIVHIAPAFGADDLALSQKEKIPTIHHVTDEGKFVATVTDFAGLSVKPKGNPKETDQKIAEALKEKGILFKEEKFKHSYPHCWRCDTPLLNWAANSWFVNVQKVKDKLLTQNAKVHWVPEHVGRGRFNNGLESAPDWAISRSRFWGAPLPVWRHTKTKEIKVVGSVHEMLSMVRRSGNRYFVMRHGQAESNVTRILDSEGREDNHLTEKGRNQVVHSAHELRKEKIDLILTSPILRTKETASIVQRELGLSDAAVMVDERLRERGLGDYNGKSVEEWKASFKNFADEFNPNSQHVEDFVSLRKRMGEFLFEVERRYTNRNILIVTHGDPFWAIRHIAKRTPAHSLMNLREPESYPTTADWEEISFVQFPHNDDYDLP
ncbi:class I tRNA ligase family protein, partial [Candidatus Parcubacteria bacterium]|nr:class I tRNA ligase family protein [Candidatus Parcubacteria bacterium]